MRFYSTLLAVVITLSPYAPLWALPDPMDTFRLESDFLLPQSDPFQSEKLSSKEYRRRIRVHGLRLAPLDASIWGVKFLDRTDSRNLVPIRPYFLRVSENPDFRAHSIRLSFTFEKAEPKKILKDRSRLDPVLDVSFGGRYLPGPSLGKPRVDQDYVLRLSAFPPLPSAFYFRSQESYKALDSFLPPAIKTNLRYDLEVSFRDSLVNITLRDDSHLIAETQVFRDGLDHGLISLTTSWHPVRLTDLRVEGVLRKGTQLRPVSQSGLISLGS